MLGTNEDLKITPVNYLPEYGGPDVVADNNVPSGWCNQLDEKISGANLLYYSAVLEWWA